MKFVAHCRHPDTTRFLCGQGGLLSNETLRHTGNTFTDTTCDACILLAFSLGIDPRQRYSHPSEHYLDE